MNDLPTGGWFDRHAEKEAARDRMKGSDRGGEIVGVVITLLFALYFLVLYTSSSGFFTSEFSTLDAVLFFGVAFLGFIPSVARAVVGRRNAVRPLDIAWSVVVIIVGVYFLLTFPFDFSHLADALPSSVRFLVSWISNDIAKALLVIGLVVGAVMIPYNAALYLAVRRKLHYGRPVEEVRPG